ncbi:MAG TPA: efflux RND transporter periplasmic adaptor subunit [Henriciella marina]|uniref:efflux RND transporter periplasmic adaptor subunit n=1 Tax=Henriciella sp. TaxID=1968823 RepID=UPI0018569A4C|nr:efflux RND transporter periplasmic adaptor subunit [Henriciella sp.]HIG21870.1 efflux RND transporter periplasmic adaptor subunit [Henriciella sp.]HIK66038.1 efflux RND transporter periplasmic adaptor subunit [Henriciella marina]
MSEDYRSQESEKKPSWIWWVAGLGVLGLGILIMMLAGAGSGPEEGAVAQEDSIPYVETVRPEQAGSTFMVRAPGRIQPRERLDLVGEVSGKVTNVNPDLQAGGRISRGETILQIDDGDLRANLERAQAQLATAEARLSQAEAERDRQINLADIGASPEKAAEQAIAAYEDAESGVRQARSQLVIARRNLQKSSIVSPFDAIVVSETVAPGTFVSPGQPLARLISAGEGEIQAGLPAKDVRAVRSALAVRGDNQLPVRAVPNASSLSATDIDGYLAEFSPEIDQQSRTATVIAVFPDAFAPENQGDIFAGDYMDLLIEGRSETPMWRVPDGAVRQDAFVWVVGSNEQIRRVEVETVDRDEDGVLIRAPELAEDDRLMLTVLAEEIDGMRVHLQETQS